MLHRRLQTCGYVGTQVENLCYVGTQVENLCYIGTQVENLCYESRIKRNGPGRQTPGPTPLLKVV